MGLGWRTGALWAPCARTSSPAFPGTAAAACHAPGRGFRAPVGRAWPRVRRLGLGLAIGSLAGASMLALGCASEPCHEDAAPLVVAVGGDLCVGTVTTQGACSSVKCMPLAQPDPGCCTEWDGNLLDQNGNICTVTLSLPDGGTLTRQVVVERDPADPDCISGSGAEF